MVSCASGAAAARSYAILRHFELSKGLWGAKITSVAEMLPELRAERKAERKSDRQVINAGPALGCNAPTLPRT